MSKVLRATFGFNDRWRRAPSPPLSLCVCVIVHPCLHRRYETTDNVASLVARRHRKFFHDIISIHRRSRTRSPFFFTIIVNYQEKESTKYHNVRTLRTLPPFSRPRGWRSPRSKGTIPNSLVCRNATIGNLYFAFQQTPHLKKIRKSLKSRFTGQYEKVVFRS